MIKSIDGHSTFSSVQNSTESISFFPCGTTGDLFIEMEKRLHRGKETFTNRRLRRDEVEYLVAALQQHLEETKDGKPWWERTREGEYPNAPGREAADVS